MAEKSIEQRIKDIIVEQLGVNVDASKCVILPIPHFPAKRFSHAVCMSFPSGETIPKPVITTRLSVQLLAIN